MPTKGAMGVDVFAARPGHGGCELAVQQSNERDRNTADNECRDSTDTTCRCDPVSGE